MPRRNRSASSPEPTSRTDEAASRSAAGRSDAAGAEPAIRHARRAEQGEQREGMDHRKGGVGGRMPRQMQQQREQQRPERARARDPEQVAHAREPPVLPGEAERHARPRAAFRARRHEPERRQPRASRIGDPPRERHRERGGGAVERRRSRRSGACERGPAIAAPIAEHRAEVLAQTCRPPRAGRRVAPGERKERDVDLQLSGRRALVTGGSKGIGRAAAFSLAAEGCEIVLVARSQDTLDAAAAEIRSRHQVGGADDSRRPVERRRRPCGRDSGGRSGHPGQ